MTPQRRRVRWSTRRKMVVPTTQIPADQLPEDLRHSSIPDPVDEAWRTADSMYADARAKGQPAPHRRHVVTEMVRQGIAFYTARTQFQAWYKWTKHGRHLMVDGNVPDARRNSSVA